MAGPLPQQLRETWDHMPAAADRQLSLNDPLSQEMSYEFLFAGARRSAGCIKAELDKQIKRKSSQLPKGDTTSDLYKQVTYYKMLAELYNKNVQTSNMVAAYLNDGTASGAWDDGKLKEHYAVLLRWYSSMEKEMRRVLDLPSSEVAEHFEGLRNIVNMISETLQDHPKKSAGVVGAVIGWSTSIGFGGLAGLFFLFAGTTLYNALREQEPVLRKEDTLKFDVISDAVENLKAIDLSECLEEDLRKISQYWESFSDFDAAVDSPTSPVCHGELQRPVRFPGCVGRHFHCLQCRDPPRVPARPPRDSRSRSPAGRKRDDSRPPSRHRQASPIRPSRGRSSHDKCSASPPRSRSRSANRRDMDDLRRMHQLFADQVNVLLKNLPQKDAISDPDKDKRQQDDCIRSGNHFFNLQAATIGFLSLSVSVID
eukprot:TRINITY_DN4878_c0_g1_i6.p1 TRINITY_DN4878_c0_g1~~TRINITY_DN4878_c0_g1_i6.p1  ORF type:complete len:426 (-),score=69.34 TRINITY_DN4878_c0_g1_i6:224-1501(-)